MAVELEFRQMLDDGGDAAGEFTSVFPGRTLDLLGQVVPIDCPQRLRIIFAVMQGVTDGAEGLRLPVRPGIQIDII